MLHSALNRYQSPCIRASPDILFALHQMDVMRSSRYLSFLAVAAAINVKIRAMIALRLSRQMIRTVLMLYMLSIGVAMASPLIHPQAMQLVCSGSGFKLIKVSEISSGVPDNSRQSVPHLLDCPMCLAVSLPPSLPTMDAVAPSHALSYVQQAIPAARLASLVSAPLPARGPPALR